jgi:hypothetical protein
MGVNRETKVEQSVQAYAKVKLEDNGWTDDRVEFLESFPDPADEETPEPDTRLKSYVAFGFNFDDQGVQAELGSPLRRRTYTLEFFVFGRNELESKSIANEMKFILDVEERVPLLDVGEVGSPVIDYLLVKGASAQKVLVGDPAPHERHVWLCTSRVEDTYYPGT